MLANAILDHDKIVIAFVIALIMFVIAAVLSLPRKTVFPLAANLFGFIGFIALTVGFLYQT